MGHLLKNISVAFVILLMTLPVLGQNVVNTEINDDKEFKLYIIQLSFDVGVPRGLFATRMNETAIGLSYNFFVQRKFLSKWFFGANIDWHQYFAESEGVTGLDERMYVRDFSIQFKSRYYPTEAIWKFEPYVNAFAGPRVIYTNTNVVDTFSGNSVEFTFDRGGVVLDYGVGIGFSFNLGSYSSFINLEANYHLGTSTTFDRRERDGQGEPTGLLEESNARFEQVIFKFGYSKAF